MPRLLTDDEIAGLLEERKPLPDQWRTRLALRSKADRRYRQRDLDLTGEQGRHFRVVLRQSTINLLDFSIVLLFVDAGGETYRLCRYNGRHPSAHTNRWEKQQGLEGATFRDRFHIHHATERYQLAEGLDIDGFAEPTEAYSSFDDTALDLFLQRHGFVESGQVEGLLPFDQGNDDDQH